MNAILEAFLLVATLTIYVWQNMSHCNPWCNRFKKIFGKQYEPYWKLTTNKNNWSVYLYSDIFIWNSTVLIFLNVLLMNQFIQLSIRLKMKFQYSQKSSPMSLFHFSPSCLNYIYIWHFKMSHKPVNNQFYCMYNSSLPKPIYIKPIWVNQRRAKEKN